MSQQSRWVRLPAVIVLGLVMAFILGLTGSAASLPLNSVQRINVAYDGGLANNESSLGLAISADGRYAAFASAASNIVPGDTNGHYDIFWRDMVTHQTKLVSVSMDGTFTPHGAINLVDMTPDGRYVVFASDDPNYVPGDTNGTFDVFRRDMVSNETTLVSSAPDGTIGNAVSDSGNECISADGRYVAFETAATNLVSTPYNNSQTCVVKDLQSGETTCPSMGYNGVPGDGNSFYPTISGDGNKVAFLSYANNIVAGTTGGLVHAYVHDMQDGESKRVDAKPNGDQSDGAVDFDYCRLDFTGRHAVFASGRKDLVADPVGSGSQVYLRDTESDETTVVAHATDGGVPNSTTVRARISGDGRFVSFASAATNLIDNDANGVMDVFVRDMSNNSIQRVNLNENGAPLDQFTMENALSANGSVIAFESLADNILPPYSGSYSHLYLRVFRSDDVTPPTASSDAVAQYDGQAAISISATDGPDGTGIADIYWQLDSSATRTVDAASAEATAGPGHHHLYILAEDGAGNKSVTYEASFTVLAVPTIDLTSASKTLSTFGQKYTLTGILRYNGAAVPGKLVRLRSLIGATWMDTGVSAVTAADGSFALAIAPLSKATYRALFPGDATDYADASSATWVVVTSVPSVGTPSCSPKWSHKKKYTVSGVLKPQHAAGSSPVRIYMYRLVGRKLKAAGYVLAKVVNSGASSKYSASFKITTKGKWGLRAFAPADAGHAAAWSSGYCNITVK